MNRETIEALRKMDALDEEAHDLFEERAYRACEDGWGELTMAVRIAEPFPLPLYWTYRETIENGRRLVQEFQDAHRRDEPNHPYPCQLPACPNCNEGYDPESVESHLLLILNARRAVWDAPTEFYDM